MSKQTPAHRRITCRTVLCSSTAISGALAALLVTASVTQPALANPQGGKVVSGQATIAPTSPTRLDIRQTSDKAIIEWRDFSIGANEHTHFQQPSAASVALNRVIEANPSHILGKLTANGQVWLVNPHGIHFGTQATVDVAGLVATTHDIANEDFMAGRYVFRAGDTVLGSVVNEGTITAAEAGLVGLVAPHVVNRGIITARLGEVTLASGKEFVVDLYGDQMINLALDRPIDEAVVDGETALVENEGAIFADGGYVQLTAAAARGIVDNLVDTSGVIQARSVEQRDGEIVLMGGEAGIVTASGTLDASGAEDGATGGTVRISGEKVGLMAGARVDVSGKAGGGTALVGTTDGQRGGAAQVTYIDAAATITADATDAGDGGRIIVWSDDTTRSAGTLTARGGANGGDGGFIETSGKLSLEVRGVPDASAPKGKAGTWLLDPTDVEISASTTTNVTSSGGTFTPASVGPAVIAAADIEAALNAGTSVTITTESAGSENGDIWVSEPITKTAGGDATLTLDADRNIELYAAITSSSGALSMTFAAGGYVYFDAGVDANGGTLRVSAASDIGQSSTPVLRAGDVILEAVGGIGDEFNPVVVEATRLAARTNANDVVLDAVGDVTLADLAGWGYAMANGAAADLGTEMIDLWVSGNLTIAADVVADLGASVILDATGSITQTAGRIATEGLVDMIADDDLDGVGDFSQAAGAIITAGSVMLEGVNVGLRRIDAFSALIYASAAITDLNTSGTTIDADSVSVEAATGIGTSSAPLRTLASSIEGFVSGAGGIHISDAGTGSIYISSLMTTDGDLVINAPNATITDFFDVDAGGTGTVSVTADVLSINFGGSLQLGGTSADPAVDVITQAEMDRIQVNELSVYNVDTFRVGGAFTLTAGRSVSVTARVIDFAANLTLRTSNSDPNQINGSYFHANPDAYSDAFAAPADAGTLYLREGVTVTHETGRTTPYWTASGARYESMHFWGENDIDLDGAVVAHGSTLYIGTNHTDFADPGLVQSDIDAFDVMRLSVHMPNQVFRTAGNLLFDMPYGVYGSFGTVDIRHAVTVRTTDTYHAGTDRWLWSYLAAVNDDVSAVPFVIASGGSLTFESSGTNPWIGMGLRANDMEIAGAVRAAGHTLSIEAGNWDANGNWLAADMKLGAAGNTYDYMLELSQTELNYLQADFLRLGGRWSHSSDMYPTDTIYVSGPVSISAVRGVHLTAEEIVVGANLTASTSDSRHQDAGLLLEAGDVDVYEMSGQYQRWAPLVIDSGVTVRLDGQAGSGIVLRATDMDIFGSVVNASAATGNPDAASYISIYGNERLPVVSETHLGGSKTSGMFADAYSAGLYVLELTSDDLARLAAEAVSLGSTISYTTTAGDIILPNVRWTRVRGEEVTVQHQVTSLYGGSNRGIGFQATGSSLDFMPFELTASGAIVLTGGGLKIEADDVELFGTIEVDGGRIEIVPHRSTEDLRLGGMPASLTLSQDEIDRLTSSALRFGSTAGPLQTGGTVDLSRFSAVEIVTKSATISHDITVSGGSLTLTASSGSISTTSGATITASTLNLSATGTVTADVSATTTKVSAASGSSLTGTTGTVTTTDPTLTVNGVPQSSPTSTVDSQIAQTTSQSTTATAPTTSTTTAGDPLAGTTGTTDTTATTTTTAATAAPATTAGTGTTAPTSTISSDPTATLTQSSAPVMSQVVNSAPVVTLAETVRQSTATGGAHEAVVAVGRREDLSGVEQQAVFRSVGGRALAKGLAESANPVAQGVGKLLGEVLEQSQVRGPAAAAALAKVSVGQIRQMVQQGGFDKDATKAYLAMFLAVQKEARTNLFGGAIAELQRTPNVADLFTTAEVTAPAQPVVTTALFQPGAMTPLGLREVKGNVGKLPPNTQVRINGRWVFIDENGNYDVDLPVQEGENTVAITIADDNGVIREEVLTFQSDRATPPGAMAEKAREGKRIAIMFANSDYQNEMIPELVTPEADVTLIGNQLNEMLGYDVRVIRNATKEEMVQTLMKLGKEVGEDDRVVVYYAGHGYALESTGKGYWLPADADVDSAAKWVSTDDIAHLLQRMPSKHIMLVADSCYSGAFTREQGVISTELAQSPQEIIGRRSVMAMSSGGDEPVADGDVNSPFAKILSERLQSIVDVEEGFDLFNQVKTAVVEAVPQTPHYGVVKTAGYDDGGDYLFFRKTASF